MTETYDVAIVGGGIAGAGLATVLARAGKRVLVLEKTHDYRDMVRGEWIAPWGVVEAKRTGLFETLCTVSDHHITYHAEFGDGIDPVEANARRLNLSAFLPDVPGPLAIGHPQACQALWDAAVAAGAEGVRGVEDVTIRPGESPQLDYTQGGASHQVSCRLVVGADGRGSGVRRQAGMALLQEPGHHFFAGMLVDAAGGWPDDLQTMGTEGDVQFFAFPQGHGRIRLYLGYGLDQKSRFAGDKSEQRFLEAFRLQTVPNTRALAEATPAGPCGSIPNQSALVESPVAPGLVLIGDAAGYNDPIIGQGLSIALRDVRIVGEALLSTDAWTPALFSPYVAERTERMRRLSFAARHDSILHVEFGPEATARKLRFMERQAADPSFALSRAAVMIGPELLPPEVFSDAEWDRLMAV
ncbi:MAG: FAD-dependent oxidoreductase [Tepidiformaceae bacterium]